MLRWRISTWSIPDIARGDIDQTFDNEGRLRPAGAAIGVDRHGVGEHDFTSQ